MKIVIDIETEVLQTLIVKAGETNTPVERLIADILRQKVETQRQDTHKDWRAIVHEMYAQNPVPYPRSENCLALTTKPLPVLAAVLAIIQRRAEYHLIGSAVLLASGQNASWESSLFLISCLQVFQQTGG